jgi:hypothetical protein
MFKMLIFALVCTVFLGAKSFFAYSTALQPGVTWTNFHMIRVGMTELEIESILGAAGVNPVPLNNEQAFRKWSHEDIDIYVIRDLNNCVTGAWIEDRSDPMHTKSAQMHGTRPWWIKWLFR